MLGKGKQGAPARASDELVACRAAGRGRREVVALEAFVRRVRRLPAPRARVRVGPTRGAADPTIPG